MFRPATATTTRRLCNLVTARQPTRFTARPMSTSTNSQQTKEESQAPEQEVLFHRSGSALQVTLHRPRQLNALNLPMVREITEQYNNFLKEKGVDGETAATHIVMRGYGDRAFCAGGDIKAIAESRDPAFFQEEYQLNLLIGTMPAVHVALLNGITMGGGVGLSVHGKFRVATEKTVFAMPESGIGFFCDVGGSFVLSRLGPLGMYFALTGSRLKGAQCVAAGIATHFVESAHLDALEKKLLEAGTEASDNMEATIEAIIREYAAPSSSSLDAANTEISQLRSYVEEVFRFDRSVQEIVSLLEKEASAADQEKSEWAKATLTQLGTASPTSLRIIHRQLTVGSQLSLKECFDMELGIAKQMMKGLDFFEGVRALLVDKDKTPKWQPATVDQVRRQDVDQYFTGYEHLAPKGDMF